MATLSNCVSCGIEADGNVLSVSTGDPEWPYGAACSVETFGSALYCDDTGVVKVDPSPRLPFFVTGEGSISYGLTVPDSLTVVLYQDIVIPNPSACLPLVIDYVWENEVSWDIDPFDRVYVYLSTELDYTDVQRYINYINNGGVQQTNTGWTLTRREAVIIQPGETYSKRLAVSVAASSTNSRLRRVEFRARGTTTVIQTA
jgi:hypothetical protein